MNLFIEVSFLIIEVHLRDEQSTRIEGGYRSMCTSGLRIRDSSMLVENLGVGVSEM